MKKKLLAILGLATIIGALAIPGAAQAHDFNIGGPFACGPLAIQICGDGGPRNNHTAVTACDDVRDGYGFFMQYRLQNGQEGSVADTNGASSGCGFATVTNSNNPVVWVRPCSNQGAVICWLNGMDA